MDWLREWLWLVWLGVALAAGVAEVTTLDLIFIMIAGGALAGAVSAAASGGSLVISVLVFAVATAVLLFVARPPLLRYMRASAPPSVTNTAALVGRPAIAISPVTHSSGTVKLAGEVWSAKLDAGQPEAEPGSQVTVVRIDGATAVVAPAATHQLPPG